MMSLYFDVSYDVKIAKHVANSRFFTDCKSAAYRFDGSNPSSPTTKSPTPMVLDFLY
jgi:hypothetical protein